MPDRIHTALTYPIRAPNGSTIIIYGHEQGLTVVWRGGRPLPRNKSSSAPAVRLASNALKNGDDSIMIIDDDDDDLIPEHGQEASLQPTLNDFDAVEDEYDISQPYEPIIDTYNIPGLNIAVLHLAVPYVAPHLGGRRKESVPSILDSQITLVAACADSSLRLFTLPLLPIRAKQGNRAQQFIVAQSKTSLRSVPRGIAVTWTSTSTDATKWCLLIAAHAAEAGGVLSVYQCPLGSRGLQFEEQLITQLRKEYIPGLATSISFSSAQVSSRRHTQLLLTDSQGTVRIYDPLPRTSPHLTRMTHDLPQNGVWLASLCALGVPARTKLVTRSTSPAPARILDAKWALGGKCVVVLFYDGQWGIWDIEGVATAIAQGNESTLLDQDHSVGSIGQLALRGFLGDSVDARSAGYSSVGSGTNSDAAGITDEGGSVLAPMTPNTRKVKQGRLFSGPMKPSILSSVIRGGISLSATSVSATAGVQDEVVVMWMGTSVYLIHSLVTYWRIASNNNTQQSTVTVFGPSVNQLNSVSTGGELITGISLMPQELQADTNRANSAVQLKLSSKVRNDILISAEHRLVLLCQSRNSRSSNPSRSRTTASSQEADLNEADLIRLDQDLLTRGQLDIGGLDRMLDNLDSGRTGLAETGRQNGIHTGLFGASKKKVGFASVF